MAEGKGGITAYVRLQIAYALEFAIWGCWSYALGSYASEVGVNVGKLYAAFAFGALFSPLIGPIADKKFAAQKVFAFMQTICALALLCCGKIASDVANSATPSVGWLWFTMMFIAGLMFMPSIPLLNAIVFKHIPNKERSPLVFIFGTLGWIAVNLVLQHVFDGGVKIFYYVDGVIALALAAYALTLPNTPPSGTQNSDPFGFKALGLFKRFDFALFILCASLVGCFGSNYYFPLVGECFGDKAVYNQYSEIVFMAALAFAVAKIGLKWTLTLGMGAWGVRYLCFAQGNDTLALVGILCHGLAYAFLYTAAYMYADRVAPKDMKASVQALVAFLLLGVAQMISGYAVDWEKDRNLNATEAPAAASTDEQASFALTPPAFAQDVAIEEVAVESADVADITSEVANVEVAAEVVANAEATDETAQEAVTEEAAEASSSKEFTVWNRTTWNKYNWKRIWGEPGVFCMVFAILFAILGREPKAAEEEEETKA